VTGGARLVPHVACLGCGCACDDITVTVRDGRISDLERVCDIGRRWFGDGTASSIARAHGNDVDVDRALHVAATLATTARRPLLYLAPELSCEAQRAAVSLADLIGARVETITSSTMSESVLASQRRGRAAVTLGELRHRADTLLYWGVDPARRYPRFMSRFTPATAGLFVGGDRTPRTVIAIDIGEEGGPADADVRTRISPSEEAAALGLLRARILRRQLPARNDDLARRVGRITEQIERGRYIVVIHDAEPGAADRGDRAEGLLALAHALNEHGRGGLCTLRGGGNRVGGDAVLTWQTGYPMSIDFSRGAPRYDPRPLLPSLERRAYDLAIVLGSPDDLPSEMVDGFRRTTVVAIGPRVSRSSLAGAEIVLDSGVPGIHDGGMAFRLDDIPLPLRQVVVGPLSGAVLIGRLHDGVRSMRSAT
jgi:formylmethanofuran dehydrogenase subunit B